jgi:WD40 repeat protein
MPFDGFISYSHAADGRLAPAVQRGLHRLGKPWHRRRALWIFRDQTGLSVTPGLWSSIQTALDGSEYFVLLASPEAAGSPWVNREVEHWIATKPAGRILPVVTDGEWAWDDDRGDFTEDSTAVPSALRGVFTEEPFFLDLRWARGSEHLSLHHSRFRDAIAQLAAPMHGVSKDELEGEDVRQHRRARRLRSGAVATVVIMALLATGTGVSAMHNAARAKSAAAEALRQQAVANSQRDNAQKSADEARRQQQLAQQQEDLASQQRARAAAAATKADESERQAKRQQTLADQATAEAKRQQKLAGQAKSRTQKQQRLADEAAAKAKKLQKEATRLAAVAAKQREAARRAAAEAKAQQAKADQQQRLAISRRLLNQATATVVGDPQTALMLGAAAHNLSPDTETRRQLAGVVTSTHFAGAIGDVAKAVYTPDGVLVGIGYDGRIALWNVANPRSPVRIAALADPAAPDGPFILSADGRTLAAPDPQHKSVLLFDIAHRSRPVLLGALPDAGDITAIAFSRDGSTLVVGDGYGYVKVWDTTDRLHPALLSTLANFRPHGVDRLALSPNGLLLIVDQVEFVPIYDLTDRSRPVSTRGLLSFGSSPMAFSPDGMTLAIGNNDGSVSLYDMTQRYADLTGPGPSWSPTASAPDQPVGGGDPNKTQVPPMPPAPLAPPSNLPWENGGDDDDDDLSSPPASLPWATDTDDDDFDDPTPSPPPIFSLPPEDDEPFDGLRGGIGAITSVAFSPDGSMVAAGDQSGTATLWDRKTAPSELAFTSVRSGSSIVSLSFAADDGTLVTTDSTATATVWHVSPAGDPHRLGKLDFPHGSALTTAFSPDGRSLTAVGADGARSTWDLTDPAHPVPGAGPLVSSTPIWRAAFSPDRRKVATIGRDDDILRLTDVAHPARTTALGTLPDEVRRSAGLAFSPDGRTLAVLSDTTTLMLWNVADVLHPALLARLTTTDLGSEMSFSPDGRTLAVANMESPAVTLWNVADRAAPVRLSVLLGHSSFVESVTYSPNGHYLVTGSYDSTAMLWDVADPAHPRRIATLTGHTGLVNAAAFSSDGQTLATGGADASVIVWDIANPTVPTRLASIRNLLYGLPYDMSFQPGGHALVVTDQGDAGTTDITLWDLTELDNLRAEPAKYACTVAGRGLDAAEWARYIPEIPYRRTC